MDDSSFNSLISGHDAGDSDSDSDTREVEMQQMTTSAVPTVVEYRGSTGNTGFVAGGWHRGQSLLNLLEAMDDDIKPAVLSSDQNLDDAGSQGTEHKATEHARKTKHEDKKDMRPLSPVPVKHFNWKLLGKSMCHVHALFIVLSMMTVALCYYYCFICLILL